MRTEARLAARFVRRGWRSGELRLLFAATALGALLATLVAGFADRMERALVHRSAEFLGADLLLSGSRPPSADILALARREGFTPSRAADFSTMLATGSNDNVLLVAASAVGADYPLRGRLATLDAGVVTPRPAPPSRGEAWLEPRAAALLGITTGDTVLIGVQPLRVTGLLAEAPDAGSGFGALAPRVLFRLDDLEASGVVQPGSRVRWRTLFAGDASRIAMLRQRLSPRLAAHEELVDVAHGSRRTAGALARALHFLALAALLGLLACGAAIALAAARHARARHDAIALLRTFGMGHRGVVRLLVGELLLVAFVAGSSGALGGLAAEALLAQLLAGLVPGGLPPADPSLAIGGLLAALVILPAFALPTLARLREVPPLHVLRREALPPSTTAWRSVLAGTAVAAGGAILLSPEPRLAAGLLAGTALFIGIALPATALLVRRLYRPGRRRWPLAWRLAAARLAAWPYRTALQVVAFTLLLTVLALVSAVRGDLLTQWQRLVPADAPNLFALNLLPHERDAFVARLAALGIAPPALYPVTPGRLLRIGEEPLAVRLDRHPELRGALERDLVLTQAPVDAASVTGGATTLAAGEASVEEKLAEGLDLAIGDRLVLLVEGREHGMRVVSLRHVDWESMKPNFYIVLGPGSLPEAPYTWLAALRAGKVEPVLRTLRAEFPAITLVETGPLLARAREYAQLMADGIGFIALLLLGAAFLLLGAAVVASLDERLAEAALLRVHGARRAWLVRTMAGEFALVGAVAGTLAWLATEVARAALSLRVLELPWHPLPALALLPLLGALLLAAAGLLAARRGLAIDALAVLRTGG